MELVSKNGLTILGRIFIPGIIVQRNKLVLDRIEKFDAKLLDLGGGSGYLASHCVCRESVSFDEAGIYEVKKNYKQEVVEVKYKRGREILKHLPYKDRCFDYVTMVALIEHLVYPIEIIKEAYRVLKQGGILIVTTPRPLVEKILWFLDRGSTQLRGKWVGKEHKQYLDEYSMKMLIREKFKLLEYKKFQLGVNQLFVLKKT